MVDVSSSDAVLAEPERGGLWMLLSDIDESRRSDAQVFDGLFSQQAFLQFGFLHRVTT